MKFNKDLAAIHGYLCSDGYVVRNPATQRHKYYRIGLRNTCPALLKDFRDRCKSFFNVNASIYRNERCDFWSKETYFKLTENDTYYSEKWSFPKLSKRNLGLWLRAYFDCDGWVFVEKRQNRHIGIDSINHTGVLQIQEALKMFGIESKVRKVKKGYMSRLLIYRKESLVNYQKHIGFLHPAKKAKLNNAINSYVNPNWNFPAKTKLRVFIIELLKRKARVKSNGIIRVDSIIKVNLTELSKILRELFKIESKVYGPWINGYGTPYYELTIQKKQDINKAIIAFSLV